MDILMVTPELSPYEKTSPAADTVAALCKALCQLEHKVTVAAPRHPGFEASGLLVARRLTPLEVEGGQPLTVLDGQLATGAKLVLFDGATADDPTLLGRAARALADKRAERGEPFDVVHLHAAAAAPFFVAPRKAAVPTVFTIHDASARGLVDEGTVTRLGAAVPPAAKDGGRVSLLALGALAADAVTAVSPTVAADLMDPSRSGSLASVFEKGTREPTGILSGLDYAVANPATDSALKSRFDAEDVSNKGSSKTDVLRSRGLEIDPHRALVVAFVSGDAEHGGELLRSAVPLILRNDASLVVVVRDAGETEASLSAFAKEFEGRMGVEVSSDEARIRRVVAGADFVLLPNPHEATGVLSRLSQRYGALPIARATGAHVDTIVDCDAELETGTGFLFDEWSEHALAGAVARALSAFSAPRFGALRRRVMRLDLSFDRAARRYVQVYKQVLAARERPSA